MPDPYIQALNSILRQTEKIGDPCREVHDIVHKISSRVTILSNQQLLNTIDRMHALGYRHTWLREPAVSLIVHAVRWREYIPLHEKIELLDRLRTYGHYQELRETLAWLARDGIYLEYEQVIEWVERAMGTGHMKSAALMLLIGDRRYYQKTSTKDLCQFLERSVCGYDGDHGVFRFFAMLRMRVARIKSSSKVYTQCVTALAEALYVVGNFDGDSFSVLLAGIQDLKPHVQHDIRTQFLAHQRDALLILRAQRKVFTVPAIS